MAQIKLYSLSTCPHCHQAKEFLSQRKYEFTQYDVGQDKAARDEMISLTNQRSVPVIVIDGQVIIGFDQGKIEAALKAQ